MCQDKAEAPVSVLAKSIYGSLCKAENEIFNVVNDKKGDQNLMKEYKLARLEARFADLIWTREPISSPELVKLCEKELDWKKSTTYTVLKKLCDRGIFQNENAVVTSLVSREEFYGYKSRQFVEDSFGGSIPRFLTAFMGGKKLTKEQAEEIKRLIDDYTGE